VAKTDNEAVTAPKHYVVTVNELLGGFLRGVIVEAFKVNCPDEMVISANHVHPIFGRLRPPPEKFTRSQKSTSVGFGSHTKPKKRGALDVVPLVVVETVSQPRRVPQ
jgi:hypothetical protein